MAKLIDLAGLTVFKNKNDAKYADKDGNVPAGKANKLTNARTIYLGTGASGSCTFDGSANTTINVENVKEAYLQWGGKNFSGNYGPIDAAMVPELGANRLMFGKANGIIVEYSRDSGSTWIDYGANDAAKINLFSCGLSFFIGKADSNNKATSDYMLRVTIDTDVFEIYTSLNKFVIYCSTNGSTGSYCTIDGSTEGTPDTFVTFANKVSISGWPGYNVINTNNIITYGNVNSYYGKVRFTFGCTGGSTTYNGLRIISIMGFGGVGWVTPSNMAKTGHLYSWDYAQNATFPAQVKAPSGGFVGSLNGNATTATTATKATQDSDGNVINTTYYKKTDTVANATYAATAGTAESATKAGRDSSGNLIIDTYLKKTGKAAEASIADRAAADLSGNLIVDTYLKKTDTVANATNASYATSAGTATAAQKDSAGNIISSTYLKKTDWAPKADYASKAAADSNGNIITDTYAYKNSVMSSYIIQTEYDGSNLLIFRLKLSVNDTSIEDNYNLGTAGDIRYLNNIFYNEGYTDEQSLLPCSGIWDGYQIYGIYSDGSGIYACSEGTNVMLSNYTQIIVRRG